MTEVTVEQSHLLQVVAETATDPLAQAWGSVAFGVGLLFLGRADTVACST